MLEAVLYFQVAFSAASTSPVAVLVAASGEMAVDRGPDVAAMWQSMPGSRAEQGSFTVLVLADGRCDDDEEHLRGSCTASAVISV